jgi:hypothetical protein
MEIPVLLEPLPDGGFRARSGDPLELREGNGDAGMKRGRAKLR